MRTLRYTTPIVLALLAACADAPTPVVRSQPVANSDSRSSADKTPGSTGDSDTIYHGDNPANGPGVDPNAGADAIKKPLPLCDGKTLTITEGELVRAESMVAQSTVKIRFETATFCTGTLIGPRHIMTAAHCLVGEKPTEVRFGLNPDKEPDLIVPVKYWISHPDFKSTFDVAIILLKDPVPATYRYAPLAKAKSLRVGTNVFFAGYGSTAETAPSKSNPLAWTSVNVESINTTRKTFSTVINGKGSCYGDSGGPGYIIDPDTSCLLAVGVTNTASMNGNGMCGQGDTAFDMTQALGWIGDSFKILSAPLPYDTIIDGTESAVSRNILGTR